MRSVGRRWGTSSQGKPPVRAGIAQARDAVSVRPGPFGAVTSRQGSAKRGNSFHSEQASRKRCRRLINSLRTLDLLTRVADIARSDVRQLSGKECLEVSHNAPFALVCPSREPGLLIGEESLGDFRERLEARQQCWLLRHVLACSPPTHVSSTQRWLDPLELPPFGRSSEMTPLPARTVS